LTIGGDHGGGKFCMTLKVLFCFEHNPSISFLFQIGSVSHSKDDLIILSSTILQPNGEGIWLIVEGGRFFVTEHQVLDFTSTNADGKLCDIPIHMLVVGDLKFYAQIL
jgi:hypothetical protein